MLDDRSLLFNRLRQSKWRNLTVGTKNIIICARAMFSSLKGKKCFVVILNKDIRQ